MPINEETKATGMWNATRLIDERTSNSYVGIDFDSGSVRRLSRLSMMTWQTSRKRFAIC